MSSDHGCFIGLSLFSVGFSQLNVMFTILCWLRGSHISNDQINQARKYLLKVYQIYELYGECVCARARVLTFQHQVLGHFLAPAYAADRQSHGGNALPKCTSLVAVC